MPPGPAGGDSAEDVVSGFLVAMTGNPVGIPVARRFLDAASRETWRPSQAIVAYDSARVTGSATVGEVSVTLGGVRRFDSRGGWLGGSESTTRRMTLRLTVEDGEWRVSDPPDALVVPTWFFAEHYRPLSLYFLDQTGTTLVPNRVFVPRGDDAPTALVRGLLGGPGAALAPVTRTAVPARTGLDLSVVVRDGVADVPLSGPVASLPGPRLAQVLAQVTTTLRQVPTIRRVRLRDGDAPLTLPNGQRSVSVEYGARYSPRVDGSSEAVYGLRGGRLVSGGGSGSAVDGPLGAGGLDLRSVGVAVTGDRATGVGADGRSVLAASLDRDDALSGVRRVYTGVDVLRPAYDMFDRTWLVDRRPGGARVVLVDDRGARVVQVPGVTGRRVTAFLVSRDGTRLVALVDGRRLTSNLLLRDADGGVRRVLGARAVPGVPAELGTLVDLSWYGPSDVAVLGRPATGVSEVTFTTVDGSPGDPDVVPPDTWRGAALGLVGSWDPSLPLYLVVPDERAGRRVLVLDRATRRWRDSALDPGLLGPTPRAGPGRGHRRAGRLHGVEPATLTDAVLDLVTGSACVACARPGRALCARCRSRLPLAPLATAPDPCPPGLAPACAAGAYADALRAMVLAHKEHAVLALTRVLGDLLALAVTGLLDGTRGAHVTGVVLVPVPSRPSVVRARGHDPVLRMTGRAARVLSAGPGPPVRVQVLLRQVRRPRDQAGLDAEDRRRNLLGSTGARARPVARLLAAAGPPPLVVVCDDVLTTGWTARESQRALEVAGLRVGGIACVAATRRRRGRSALVP
ncbi:hypothetical protein LUZ63_020058 [Rhynchospora breviuscula]|uniref:GerMN domain-containing protein n=1 Tax=Rhynchospora breviuscula TaxID=2022672 RepID=A0A9P9Z9F3_9POAL|nr:hypothetical protein LUZ63_020058 [Rhynchospora breviuscula]